MVESEEIWRNWDDPFKRVIVELYVLKEMKQQMVKIRQNLKAA